jgi:hypothetical protein
MYAAIGTDGTRYVVWGLGKTEDDAEHDAASQDTEEPVEIVAIAPVDAERAARIEAGDVAADDLVTRATRLVQPRVAIASEALGI